MRRIELLFSETVFKHNSTNQSTHTHHVVVVDDAGDVRLARLENVERLKRRHRRLQPQQPALADVWIDDDISMCQQT